MIGCTICNAEMIKGQADKREVCPKCGQSDFAVARNMLSTRHCKCGATWPCPPKDEKQIRKPREFWIYELSDGDQDLRIIRKKPADLGASWIKIHVREVLPDANPPAQKSAVGDEALEILTSMIELGGGA